MNPKQIAKLELANARLRAQLAQERLRKSVRGPPRGSQAPRPTQQPRQKKNTPRQKPPRSYTKRATSLAPSDIHPHLAGLMAPFDVAPGTVYAPVMPDLHTQKVTQRATYTLTPNASGNAQALFSSNVCNDRCSIIYTHDGTHVSASNGPFTRTAAALTGWTGSAMPGPYSYATLISNNPGLAAEARHSWRINVVGVRVMLDSSISNQSGIVRYAKHADNGDVSNMAFDDIVRSSKTIAGHFNQALSFEFSDFATDREMMKMQDTKLSPLSVGTPNVYYDYITSSAASNPAHFGLHFSNMAAGTSITLEVITHVEYAGPTMSSVSTPCPTFDSAIETHVQIATDIHRSIASSPNVDRAAHAQRALEEHAVGGALNVANKSGVPGASMALGVEKFAVSKQGGKDLRMLSKVAGAMPRRK